MLLYFNINIVEVCVTWLNFKLIDAEDGSRHSSASAIYAIARHAPDIMSKFLEKVLPLAYYAMHEPQDAKIQDATSTK